MAPPLISRTAARMAAAPEDRRADGTSPLLRTAARMAAGPKDRRTDGTRPDFCGVSHGWQPPRGESHGWQNPHLTALVVTSHHKGSSGRTRD